MASRKTTPTQGEPKASPPVPAGDPFEEYRETDWQRLDSSPTIAAMDLEAAAVLGPEDDP